MSLLRSCTIFHLQFLEYTQPFIYLQTHNRTHSHTQNWEKLTNLCCLKSLGQHNGNISIVQMRCSLYCVANSRVETSLDLTAVRFYSLKTGLEVKFPTESITKIKLKKQARHWQTCSIWSLILNTILRGSLSYTVVHKVTSGVFIHQFYLHFEFVHKQPGKLLLWSSKKS